MKRFLILTVLVLFPVLAFSQVINYNSTPTLEWNAPTTGPEENPLLPGDVLTYNIYYWDQALLSDSPLISEMQFYTTTSELNTVLSFPYRASWAVAVQGIHTDGGGNISYYNVSYSTEEAPVTQTGPFVYFRISEDGSATSGVTGLRDSGI